MPAGHKKAATKGNAVSVIFVMGSLQGSLTPPTSPASLEVTSLFYFCRLHNPVSLSGLMKVSINEPAHIASANDNVGRLPRPSNLPTVPNASHRPPLTVPSDPKT